MGVIFLKFLVMLMSMVIGQFIYGALDNKYFVSYRILGKTSIKREYLGFIVLTVSTLIFVVVSSIYIFNGGLLGSIFFMLWGLVVGITLHINNIGFCFEKRVKCFYWNKPKIIRKNFKIRLK